MKFGSKMILNFGNSQFSIALTQKDIKKSSEYVYFDVTRLNTIQSNDAPSLKKFKVTPKKPKEIN